MNSMTRVAVIALAAAAALAGSAPAAAPAAESAPAKDWCVHGNGLQFRAADGTRLAGARWGKGRTAVVLAHQSSGDLCEWSGYAKRLARLGYLAIPFDFRNYGDSQRRGFPASQRLAGDAAAAVKKARSLGAKKVFVVGASMGGTAVVVAGANIRRAVDGVVSVSGPANYGSVNALTASKRLAVPVLYLAGEGDVDFATDARTLYEATASTDKAIAVLPSAAHGITLVGTSAQARSLLEGFIRTH
jgi:pimeloyl-ACP methyl ester carboxylesterase